MEPGLNPHDNRQINQTLNWLLELDRKMVGSSSSSSSFSDALDSFDSEYEDAVDESASQWDEIDQSVDDKYDLFEATLSQTMNLLTENVQAALITYPWSETKPTTFYEGSGEETTSPYTPFTDEFDQIMVNLDEDYEATLGQHFPLLLATVDDLMTMPTEMTSSESSGWFMTTTLMTSTLMTTTTETTTMETTTESTTMETTETSVPLTGIVRECDDQDLCDWENSSDFEGSPSELRDGDEMVKTRSKSTLPHFNLKILHTQLEHNTYTRA